MVKVWWEEFRERDGDTGSMNLKLRQMFKGFGVRVSLKPYESVDGTLSLEPPGNPNVGYSWLPQPPRVIEIHEKDLIQFERNARISLRAANFAEAVLQAWKPEDEKIKDKNESDYMSQMKRSLSKVVKCVVQAQVATMCGALQLRRDQYLTVVKGLSVDNIQRLRHAEVIGESKIFPMSLIKELNEVNYQSLQTRAILRAAKPSYNNSYDKKPDYRGGYNQSYNNRGGQNNYNNNYNNGCVNVSEAVSSVLPMNLSVSSQEKGGGREYW